MNKKAIAILLIATLIPFGFYLLKPDLAGVDSYAFLSGICNKGPLPETTHLAGFIFSILPCNIPIIKIILWLLFFLSTLTVAKWGELFDKKIGWYAGLFLFLSPIWIKEAMKFEDDQFSFPFLFAGAYLITRGIVEKKIGYKLLGAGLIAIGGLIWPGGVYYLFAYGPLFLPVLAIAILFLVFELKKVIGSLFAYFRWDFWKPEVIVTLPLESFPFVGMINPYFLLMGYVAIEKVMLFPLITLTLITIISAKFAVHLFPILAIGILNLYKGLPEHKQTFLWTITIAALVATSAFMLFGERPNAEHWEAIDYAIEISREENLPIRNNWSFGYWLRWRGIETPYFGAPQKFTDYNNSIAITIPFEELPCNLLKKTKEIFVWRC